VPIDERYAKAEEFVDVVRAYGVPSRRNAFPRDKQSGRYLDTGN